MLARALASEVIICGVWAAERATRSLEVPNGTVGGRIAGTWKPCRSSDALAARASEASPTTIGTMWLLHTCAG